jgi:hypothetical protein
MQSFGFKCFHELPSCVIRLACMPETMDTWHDNVFDQEAGNTLLSSYGAAASWATQCKGSRCTLTQPCSSSLAVS